MRFSHRARQRVVPRVVYGIGGVLTASLLSAGAAQTQAAVPSSRVQAPIPATAPAPPIAANGGVSGRVTWDDDYVYFALQVDDADVIGTNTAPLSRPQEDDSVAVYFQTGEARPDAPDASTNAMLISAAGGFTFLQGNTATKALAPRPLFTIKYAVTVQGTLNRRDDRDNGYTVELAIPLSALGLDGKKIAAGTTIGVNVVSRAREGKPAFSSFSPNVKTESDIDSPAKWTRLVFVNPDGSGGGAVAGDGALIAPRVNNKIPTPVPPLIDGVFRAGEWPAASRFALAAPGNKGGGTNTDVNQPPTAAQNAVNATLAEQEMARDAAAPPLPLENGLSGLERLVFARYTLGYQGDRRKPIAFRGVLSDAGRFLLRDEPATGAGPWFTSDRIGWHRAQLTEMRRGGIDVALTEIGGPNGSGDASDEKALLVLVSALREMGVEQIPAPQVALFVNTRDLVKGDAKIDLSTSEGRLALYNAIRRWMLIVTPDLRARVTFAPPAPGAATAAYPVFLSDGAVFDGLDSKEWADDIRSRFAHEFGAQAFGATLLFAGGVHFEAPGAASLLAATFPTNTSGAGTGAVRTFVVQPGFDSADAPLVPRKEGETYRNAWEAAIAAQPTWTILDSWNDFTRGTEISASRQYGSRYQDETRIYTIQLGGLLKHDIRWLNHDAPRRIRPGEIVQTTLTVQNAGTTVLRPTEGVVLTYRWKQNGKIIAESPIRIPLSNPLLPTQTARLTLGLGAVRLVGSRLDALPPGDYTVEIDLATQSKDGDTVTYFADEGDTPLTVPVSITPNVAESVQFQSTTTSRLLQAGGTYGTRVRVRWTGTQPLPIGAAGLTYQFQSGDGSTTYGTKTIPIDNPLIPGQWVTLTVPLQVVDNGGQPLAAANPENRANGAATGSYRLRWLLTRSGAVETVPGEYIERVAVYPGDEEASFITPLKVPEKMDAGSLTPITVTLVNRGVSDWPKGNFALGYHWFYPDGIEAQWASPLTTLLDRAVKAGDSIKVTLPVRSPDRDGEYVLAFDALKVPGTYLSTLPVSRPADLGLTRVRVTGGRLTFVDLTKQFNVDAVATEAAPGDGDMDGSGTVLPAESFPPDLYGLAALAQKTPFPRKTEGSRGKPARRPDWDEIPAYPSSYYDEASPSARLISFRYGPDADGQKNAVRCEGQTLGVPRGSYVGIHVAAAATGGEARPLNLVLTYKDGTTQTVKRAVGDWHTAPFPSGDPVALRVHRSRSKDGDKAVECVIRHAILPVNITKELVSITLPKDPAIKVFALTLEK